MSRLRLKPLLRSWSKKQDGTAAIEFGILGPVFLALTCGIMFIGVYLYNCNRLSAATFEVSRQVMLVNEPTLANLQAEATSAFADLNLEGSVVNVQIGTRPDGGQEAVISASYTMLDPTAFLNTKGFTHEVEYRVPLWEN